MKKKIIISLLIGVIIGVFGVTAVLFIVKGEVDWREYVETQLLPNAVAALAAISALYVGATPVLNSIKSATGNFIIATDKVEKTEKNN